ncbi:MAG: biotin/lipoyl-binding protein [Gammaproteobacteria bacterium]|nr:biotin/lipoyl-binding protein [Gammaproteobacteria bacterium]
MDLRKIKKLIELVEESGITELEVRDGEEVIRIARQITATGLVPAPQPAAVAGISAPAGHSIESPMAGTFYAAGEPGGEPFLQLGAQVEIGDIVCIIESMKMMNEITAKVSGICTAVAVTNGEAVNSGQVLFRLA